LVRTMSAAVILLAGCVGGVVGGAGVLMVMKGRVMALERNVVMLTQAVLEQQQQHQEQQRLVGMLQQQQQEQLQQQQALFGAVGEMTQAVRGELIARWSWSRRWRSCDSCSRTRRT